MTFVLAVNLSDRIYLAADSLISRDVNGKREPAGYCTKLVQMSPADHKSSFSCLFSGRKSFTDYLFRRLDQALDSGEITTDINDLIAKIDPFMKRIVPEYDGPVASRIAKIIFAGCSNMPGAVKKFRLDNLNDALGPEAGHLDDANAVMGIQLGFVNAPDQKIFSYLIDDRTGELGIGEVGEMYSLIYGGSKRLSDKEKNDVLRYFLSKRDIESEMKDIINFLRNQFSDSIGGAVTPGYIGLEKRLIYVGYELDRSGRYSATNWSFVITNGNMIATDPEGKTVDLGWGFYNLPAGGNGNLEL